VADSFIKLEGDNRWSQILLYSITSHKLLERKFCRNFHIFGQMIGEHIRSRTINLHSK